jgi:glycosyltransferase involved in cell wall biosynthesis
MHIVISHGYFLNGTGSNLFVQNICRELCEMGHQVSLFCQENNSEDFDFIDCAYDFSLDNDSTYLIHSKETPYSGKCTLYKPNLNHLLPVFVYDHYTNYTVKTFIDCTQEEIENYISYNVSAINAILSKRTVDLIWSNHTIMQPVYIGRSVISRQSCKHIMTVHGSCLNFAVRKSILLEKYAWEAVSDADIISFVSDFSKNEFSEFFNHNQMIEKKSTVIPAGVDTTLFKPICEFDDKNLIIKKMLNKLTIFDSSKQKNIEKNWTYDRNIINKLNHVDFEQEKIILYYGKYLWTKGIQLLIGAVPLILQKHPNTRFIFVGIGSSRFYFEALITALDEGKRYDFLSLIKHPKEFDPEIEEYTAQFFSSLVDKLNDPIFSDNYYNTAKCFIKSRIIFTGFLDHQHLNSLISTSEITIAPSIFPEAFGMVGIEALASGIIPIQTNHSGFSEVIHLYVSEFLDVFDKNKLNSLFLDENLVLNLNNNISILLDYYDHMTQNERASIRKRARKICIEHYSWTSIAHQYLNFIESK